MTNVQASFLITSFAGLSTMIGALLIFFHFKNKDKVVCGSLAFASGVMLTISVTDLIPSSIKGLLEIYYVIPAILMVLIFMILGIVISTLINKYIPDINSQDVSNKGLFKVGIISMIAIILHNIPEGIATFMTSTQDIQLGLSLAIAISLHNIPEGISISIPIYYSTKNKWRSLLYTFISGVSEPVGAIIAYLFLAPYMNNLVMSLLLAVIAGIMISISVYELIPASLKYNRLDFSLKCFGVGILFMATCHFLM